MCCDVEQVKNILGLNKFLSFDLCDLFFQLKHYLTFRNGKELIDKEVCICLQQS